MNSAQPPAPQPRQANGGKVVGNYELVERIGSGSFSTVYRGRCVALNQPPHATEQVVAVKAIHLNRLNPKLKQAMFDEVEILNKLEHANIVRLFSTVATANTLYLLLQYCGGGDLHHYIRKHKRLALGTTQHFLRQLAQGLQFLWRHNLIHRDLKPHNLLLMEWSPTSLLKIADFGFARHLGEAKMAQTMCGSPLYMCPELLAHQNYDSKCDLWSTGVILYEMMAGHAPYEGANPEELLLNIQRTELRIPVHAETSPDAIELLRGLLRRKPAERLSYQEFFQSRFISVDSTQTGNSALERSGGGGESEEEEEGSGLFALNSVAGQPATAAVAAAAAANMDDAWEFVDAHRIVKPPPSPSFATATPAKGGGALLTKPLSSKRKHASGRAGTFAVEVGKRSIYLAKMSEQIVHCYEEFSDASASMPASMRHAIGASLVVEAMRLLFLASAAAEDAVEAATTTAAGKKRQAANTCMEGSTDGNALLVHQIKHWLAACTEKARHLLDLAKTSAGPTTASAMGAEEIPNPNLVMFKVALGLGSRCASRELLLPTPGEQARNSSAEAKREIAAIVEDYSLGLMLLQLLTTNVALKQEDRTQILGFIALFCNRLEALM